MRGVELQQMTGENRNEYLIRVQGETRTGDLFATVQRAVKTRFPNATVELRRTEAVGPKVGRRAARTRRCGPILGSLGGILIYVGIRYEFKYAFGAVAALFHDVFITLGLLCFTNREISLTVVAALLTIAGFSINDTIVVFDRIRERAKALRKESTRASWTSP